MLKCKACVRRAELVSALYWLDAEDPIPGDDPMTMDEVLLVRFTPCEHLDASPDAEERTLEDVGDTLGLSRERIRQVEAIAVEKLRRSPMAREIAGVSAVVVLAPAPPRDDPSARKDRVWGALRADVGLTIMEIAAALSLDSEQVRASLRALLRDGIVCSRGEGKARGCKSERRWMLVSATAVAS